MVKIRPILIDKTGIGRKLKSDKRFINLKNIKNIQNFLNIRNYAFLDNLFQKKEFKKNNFGLNIATSRQVVLAIGDSHIRIFEHIFFKVFLKKYIFDITYVPGATAYGIGNNNSKTKAYNLFKESLEIRNYQRIIITLGEVDTAYTLWSLAKRDKKSIDELLSVAIERYQAFLDELITYAPVIVLSASLPTIDDLADCNDSIQGVRKKVDVAQKKRTLIALRFNRKMKLFCETKHNIKFVDLSFYTLNYKTKKVKSWLVNNKNPCDHHYVRWIYALLIICKIKE